MHHELVCLVVILVSAGESSLTIRAQTKASI